MDNTKRLLPAAMAVACLAVQTQAAAPGGRSVRDMSLEELLTVEVYLPTTLTRLSPLESPSAITTITADDIRLTPARNLYDLIEVYVPGAFRMNHETGPVLGVRGNITSRNHRFLLLVDGRVMNNKAFAGAGSELEMWDLGDIERVDVVSGPGSVTYGPGAVAGVISITTRRPAASNDTAVRTGYVDHYDSKSLALDHERRSDEFSLFLHASITDTEGQEARSFQVDSANNTGYVGHDYLPLAEALDDYGDYGNDPQLKLHAALEFAAGWRWWTRYTEQGANWFSNEVKTLTDGDLLNQQGTQSRQITTALEFDTTLRDTLTLSTMLSLDSHEFARRRDRAYDPERDSPLNYQVRFAEDELFARGALNWQATAALQIAFGAEFSHDRFGPGWSDSEREMRLGESGEIINGADSLALSPGNRNSADRQAPAWPAIHVGDGWDTNTTSFFTEANLALGAGHKLLLSGRADRSTYQDWIYSPRLAWVWAARDGHVVKLVAQRASRMNTAGQMLANSRHDINNRPEEQDSLELLYSARLAAGVHCELAAFHNDAEVIAFQGADNIDRHVGRLELNGIEASLQYEWGRGRAGASVSWVKLQNWDLAPGVVASGVSYSDYDLPIAGALGGTQVGSGDDLNNWPNESFKAFVNYRLSDAATLHLDARWYGEMQGAKDGLAGLYDALDGTPSATPAFHAAMDRVEAEDAYDSDVRLNALLDYAVSGSTSVQFYAQNLFDGNGNERYAYDEATKNARAAPNRVRFVIEPRTFGLRLIHHF